MRLYFGAVWGMRGRLYQKRRWGWMFLKRAGPGAWPLRATYGNLTFALDPGVTDTTAAALPSLTSYRPLGRP